MNLRITTTDEDRIVCKNLKLREALEFLLEMESSEVPVAFVVRFKNKSVNAPDFLRDYREGKFNVTLTPGDIVEHRKKQVRYQVVRVRHNRIGARIVENGEATARFDGTLKPDELVLAKAL